MQAPAEHLKQDLDHLSSPQLQQVADFIAFLKFRDRTRRTVEPSQFAALAEFADDDRAMAEAGMSDYAPKSTTATSFPSTINQTD